MTIEEIQLIIRPYIEEPIVNFQIKKSLFFETNGRKNFNTAIRQKIQDNKFGVYIWINKNSSEVIYIGMAGKIKTDGSIGDHPIRKRLTASRGRDKISKKDIFLFYQVF